MLTDYKFWYITKDDDGFIIKTAVRFYEGEINTRDEYDDLSRTLKPVTRYRRSKELKIKTYIPNDFGSIKDDDELRVFLNGKLKLDTTRTPIDEQKETDLTKLKLLDIR